MNPSAIVRENPVLKSSKSTDDAAPFYYAKRGYLLKKGMGRFFKPWALRHFILEVNQVLTYYSGEEIKGVLTLDGASVRILTSEQADGQKYAFEIYNLNIAKASKFKSSNILLSASSIQERDTWIECLQHAVKSDLRTRAAQGFVYESFDNASSSRPF